jgi:hypothetical protein
MSLLSRLLRDTVPRLHTISPETPEPLEVRGPRLLLWLALGVVVAAVAPFLWVQVAEKPSLDRNWVPEQSMLARATIEGDRVAIDDMRDFHWQPDGSFDARYERRTYDLSRLDSAWFMVERFGEMAGVAHTLVSFGFGGEYVAISAEARREKGESFSALSGLLRQYEIAYIVAEERDVIGLRTNVRRDPVYLYRSTATPEQARAMFVDMLRRADALATRPEFYNTLTNNCTTSIVRHANRISAGIPFSFRVLLPAYSDELAYDMKLIPTDRPFAELQASHRIDARAQAHPLDADFSRVIRQFGDGSTSARP